MLLSLPSRLLVMGRPSGALNSVRSIMPTPARLYHCFQRGNAKNSYSSEGKTTFPEGKTCFSEKSGVVGHLSGGALTQRFPQGIGKRELRQRPRVHEDIDGFRGDDGCFVAGDAEGRADSERRRPETNRDDRQLEHLIEARRRLPLDGLLDELKVEAAFQKLRQHTDRAEELVDRDVD